MPAGVQLVLLAPPRFLELPHTRLGKGSNSD